MSLVIAETDQILSGARLVVVVLRYRRKYVHWTGLSLYYISKVEQVRKSLI